MAKATIVYIVDPDTNEVLMAKKRKKVGVGYWFGYGGKIEEGENPEDSICRETFEESGKVISLKKEGLERVALIRFFRGVELDPLVDEPTFEVLCYRIFMKKAEVGIPATTDEMLDPTWFPINNLPLAEMKPGDELFVPQIIAGIPIKGYVWFGDTGVLGSDILPCTASDLNFAL